MPFASLLIACRREEIGNSLCFYVHLQTSVNYASTFLIVASVVDF